MTDTPLAARREFLMAAGLGASAAVLAAGNVQAETLPALTPEQPKYKIRFGVCGMSHDHIHGMIAAIRRGGGEFAGYWGGSPTSWPSLRSAIPM